MIIKLGSNTLLKNGLFNFALIVNLAENVKQLKARGYQVVLVSSGAIASGREYLGSLGPDSIDPVVYAQMCSSVGQPLLMNKYISVFGEFGLKVSQALLTQDIFYHEPFRHSFLTMIGGLLEVGVVPIINENDALDTQEIVFSDNDMLAAYVAVHLKAERLFILSNVDGLLTAHPDEGGELVSEVREVTPDTFGFASDVKSPSGRGGMKSKLETAEFLLRHGVVMHLLNGDTRDGVMRIMDGESIGTRFLPST